MTENTFPGLEYSKSAALSKVANEFTDSFTEQSDSLEFALCLLLNSLVTVYLKSGEICKGVLSQISKSGPLCIILEFASVSEVEVPENSPPKAQTRPFEKLLIPNDYILDVETDVDLDFCSQIKTISNKFTTDAEISGIESVKARELYRWNPDKFDQDINSTSPIGDGAVLSSTSLYDSDIFQLKADTHDKDWDQFAANEKLFGIKSDFNEDIYTTKIDKTRSDYKKREQEAIKIANEIINAPATSFHILEERSMVSVSDEIDEEDRYGAVIREQSTTGKYVPPYLRTKSNSSQISSANLSQDTNADIVQLNIPKSKHTESKESGGASSYINQSVTPKDNTKFPDPCIAKSTLNSDGIFGANLNEDLLSRNHSGVALKSSNGSNQSISNVISNTETKSGSIHTVRAVEALAKLNIKTIKSSPFKLSSNTNIISFEEKKSVSSQKNSEAQKSPSSLSTSVNGKDTSEGSGSSKKNNQGEDSILRPRGKNSKSTSKNVESENLSPATSISNHAKSETPKPAKKLNVNAPSFVPNIKAPVFVPLSKKKPGASKYLQAAPMYKQEAFFFKKKVNKSPLCLWGSFYKFNLTSADTKPSSVSPTWSSNVRLGFLRIFTHQHLMKFGSANEFHNQRLPPSYGAVENKYLPSMPPIDYQMIGYPPAIMQPQPIPYPMPESSIPEYDPQFGNVYVQINSNQVLPPYPIYTNNTHPGQPMMVHMDNPSNLPVPYHPQQINAQPFSGHHGPIPQNIGYNQEVSPLINHTTFNYVPMSSMSSSLSESTGIISTPNLDNQYPQQYAPNPHSGY
ncbi:hypothetical protein BB560_005082 [Smittium megazygosporum]|uniref:LsmAD domain-containing protein n=1 Tax=Smittium megazygosporum TaxID=133381 RepID=A0A2T9Z7G6_9FUNG|nr:hypothetical protein BB560_005082 [Smittium megazygosporum]